MSFFKQVEGEAAVLVSDGIYRQVDLYSRDGYLFAKFGAGFVRLKADGSTSKSKLRLEHMSWTGGLFKDTFGNLGTSEMRNVRRSLDEATTQKLLGGAS